MKKIKNYVLEKLIAKGQFGEGFYINLSLKII